MTAALALTAPTQGAPGDRPLRLHMDEATSDWQNRLAKGDRAHLAVIGDSISFKSDTYIYYLRDLLEAHSANGGDGFLSFSTGFRHAANSGNNRRPGLDYRRSVDWSRIGLASGPRDEWGVHSVDGIFTRIAADGWMEVEFFGPEAVLHLVQEPGAGLIRVQLNGADSGVIDASIDSGPPQLGTVLIKTGNTDPQTTSIMRLSLLGATAEDPQWTQLNGLSMTTGHGGSVISRLSRGGVGPEDFLLCDGGVFESTLVDLNPDLVFVMLDHGDTNIYRASMEELLDRIESALPNAEIVLASHHHFSENRGPDTDHLIELATERGHGFLNLFDLHQSQQHLQSLGFLEDTVHLTAAGGTWFAGFIHDALLGWVIPTSVTLSVGFPLEGDLYETRASDDDRFVARSRRVSVIEPSVFQFEASFVTDALKATILEIELECHATVSDAQSVFSLRDWSSGKYVTVGSSGVPWGADGVIRLDNLDTSRFVNASTGAVDLRVRTGSFSTRTITGFLTHIDSLRIRAE